MTTTEKAKKIMELIKEEESSESDVIQWLEDNEEQDRRDEKNGLYPEREDCSN